jgi:hypothetical protein
MNNSYKKNYTRNGKANHPQLEIPTDRLLMHGMYLLATMVVALQEVVVTNP